MRWGTLIVKLDMGQAWNDALSLLRGNQQVVLIVAGVFFFLPNLALSLLMPETMAQMETGAAGRAGGEPDFDAVVQQAVALYGDIWWQLMLVSLLSAIGMLGLLALLTDRDRPTVGEALKAGIIYLLPYIGAQILIGLIVGLIILVPVAASVAAGVGAAALLGVLALVAVVYIYTKFSLAIPVIVIEETMNPVRALGRSWSLTKGNSVRLFLFYLLIFVVFVVVMMVLGIVGGAIGLFAGEDGSIIINGLIGAAANMGGITLYLAVLAAVHRQLSGLVKEVGATFE
jgi:hypothetical protein